MKVSQNLTRASKVRGTGCRGLATAPEPYDVVVIGGGAFLSGNRLGSLIIILSRTRRICGCH